MHDTATPKDIAADVLLIKEFLRQHIGTTYASATQPSDANLLGVDMSDWGGLRRPRVCAPFNQLRGANGGYRLYVRRQAGMQDLAGHPLTPPPKKSRLRRSWGRVALGMEQ